MQSGGSSPARPPVVQTAAILLFVAGGLNVLSALLVFSIGAAGAVFGFIGLVVGAAAIYAGMQILQLREQGRVIGTVVAGIGAILSLIYIVQGNVFSIIGLLLYGFILYALITSQSAFHR